MQNCVMLCLTQRQQPNATVVFIACLSYVVGEKGRPNSSASDEGENTYIIDQNLGYIRNGFQKVQLDSELAAAVTSGRGELKSSPCDSPDGSRTPEFSRSGSLRGSKRGRLQAIDENKKAGDEEDKRTRKSTDMVDSEDLIGYLMAGEDGDKPGVFDRQGSQRSSRRRRTKNIDIAIDRERAPSPASVNSNSGPNSPTERVVGERTRWRSHSGQDMGVFERRGSGRASSPLRNAPSPLVTSELASKNRISNCSVETNDSSSSRWSNCSSEVSIGDSAEDDGRKEMERRRQERRRRSIFDNAEGRGMTRNNTSSPALSSLTRSDSNSGPRVERSISFEGKRRQYRLGSNGDKDNKSNDSSVFDSVEKRDSIEDSDNNNTKDTTKGMSDTEKLLAKCRQTRQQFSQNPSTSSVDDVLKSVTGDSTENGVDNAKDNAPNWTNRINKHSDVDEAIQHVERQGREIHRIIDDKKDTAEKDSITSRLTSKWSAKVDESSVNAVLNQVNEERSKKDNEEVPHTPTISAKRSRKTPRTNVDRDDVIRALRGGATMDSIDSSSPVAPTRRSRYRNRQPSADSVIPDNSPMSPNTYRRHFDSDDHTTPVDRALLEHASGRWRSNSRNDDESQDEVSNLFTLRSPETPRKQRPYSTYDNLPDIKPELNSKSFASSTGDMSKGEPPAESVTRRWGRVLEDVPMEETNESPSPLRRSNTLPRRWRQNMDLSKTNAAETITEEKPTEEVKHDDTGYFSLDRSNRTRVSLRGGLRKLRSESADDAPVLTSTYRRNVENDQLNQKLEDFKQHESAEDKRRKNRFKGLAQRYNSQDEESPWSAPVKKPIDSENYEINNRSSGDNSIFSPRSSAEIKSDTDSAKDEGFESGSVSDPNVSQRTSMSSTLESELSNTPNLKRKDYNKGQKSDSEQEGEEPSKSTQYFARSIDSLVHRGDLTLSETINIDEDIGNKTPTQEEKSLDIRGTPSSEVDSMQRTLTNTPEFESQEAPPPPTRTTSKSSSSTPSSASSTKSTRSRTSTSTASKPTKPSPASSSSTRPSRTTPTSTTPTSRPSRPTRPTPGSATSRANPTAASVTDRLSRPKRPTTNLQRHASNSSVASEASNGSTGRPGRTRLARSGASSANSSGRSSMTSPRQSTATPPRSGRTTPTGRSTSTGRSSTPTGKTTPSSPKFVRGAAGRATMPASVLRTQKRAAAESREAKNLPVPPRRTSSIRVSERTNLSNKTPTSADALKPPASPASTPKFNRRTATSQSYTARDMSKPDSKMTRLITRLSKTKEVPAEDASSTSSSTPRARSARVSPATSTSHSSSVPNGKPVHPRNVPTSTLMQPTAASEKRSTNSGFMKNIMPTRKSTESPATERRSRGGVTGLKATTKSTKC